jgi:Zn-dependent protease
MSDVMPLPHAVACGGCGNAVPFRLKVCPSCHALLHRERLESLARAGENAEANGQWNEAVRAWREALELLPPGTRQHEAVAARITAATPHLDAEGRAKWSRYLGPLGAAGAALWKVKFLIAGLTKLTTLISMLAFLGVYWTLWGWRFALAIVLTTYIHEMGHVAALTRRGIAAEAPMFVPGFGAYVRMSQMPATPAEDARIGLAGPVWGVAAALVCLGIAQITGGGRFWLAVAHVTAIINLFNLVPVWQLDGSRGARALTRLQRGLITLLTLACWPLAREGMFFVVTLAAGWRTAQKDAPAKADWPAFAEFAGLLAVITAVIYVAPR